MLRRIGSVTGTAGAAAGFLGALWAVLAPTPDANIGAGLVVLAGGVLVAGGAALLVVLLIVRPRALRPRSETQGR